MPLPASLPAMAAGGHTIGNHGFSHLNGLTTSIRAYCSDILRGRDITCSNLFRPPYGRLRVRQYRILERSMRIVFWDLMPYDFDRKLSPEHSYSILSTEDKARLCDRPARHCIKQRCPLPRQVYSKSPGGGLFIRVR
ncbi:MAG: hypothetical protein MZV63_44200 [Marinilabiliales bacterium]|nr:hypothetical protein [Marinilabiliales bacterium]